MKASWETFDSLLSELWKFFGGPLTNFLIIVAITVPLASALVEGPALTSTPAAQNVATNPPPQVTVDTPNTAPKTTPQDQITVTVTDNGAQNGSSSTSQTPQRNYSVEVSLPAAPPNGAVQAANEPTDPGGSTGVIANVLKGLYTNVVDDPINQLTDASLRLLIVLCVMIFVTHVFTQSTGRLLVAGFRWWKTQRVPGKAQDNSDILPILAQAPEAERNAIIDMLSAVPGTHIDADLDSRLLAAQIQNEQHEKLDSYRNRHLVLSDHITRAELFLHYGIAYVIIWIVTFGYHVWLLGEENNPNVFYYAATIFFIVIFIAFSRITYYRSLKDSVLLDLQVNRLMRQRHNALSAQPRFNNMTYADLDDPYARY